MTASSPSQRWQPLPASSLLEALAEDEDIEDVVALSAAEIPESVRQLSIPTGWQLLELPDNPEPPLVRIAVQGSLGDGEWEAADTISVFGYTGWPVFYDVFHNADGVLRDLNATHVAVKALPMPAIQRAAALRASGSATIRGRRVWIQQSTYVAGSERPHGSRLFVHSLFVDAACRARLNGDVAQLSEAVHHGLIAALVGGDGGS
ncbi:hypothetical protein [Mycobacterium parmense]|uniref:Uncharacterized protein n=1 Tax=Mycobacterium parmense TaxID=185642 RepID=A0A7I7YW00_9MYCO|nr:hypothetical protein [Mycobacterium parmense]MCV7350724.1 hypothetical protein [Mycobacterium parmense]BBZ45849.1 hypothetical protein MPRM_31300 [Mycobacterium parmense]